jgi:hypothetical protein
LDWLFNLRFVALDVPGLPLSFILVGFLEIDGVFPDLLLWLQHSDLAHEHLLVLAELADLLLQVLYLEILMLWCWFLRADLLPDVLELLLHYARKGLIAVIGRVLPRVAWSQVLHGSLPFLHCACPYFSGFIKQLFAVFLLIWKMSHFKY